MVSNANGLLGQNLLAAVDDRTVTGFKMVATDPPRDEILTFFCKGKRNYENIEG